MLLWTVTIVVLPFPTALVAGHDASNQATTKILYVGTMAASSLVLGPDLSRDRSSRLDP